MHRADGCQHLGMAAVRVLGLDQIVLDVDGHKVELRVY
jgi:hypothetical protein